MVENYYSNVENTYINSFKYRLQLKQEGIYVFRGKQICTDRRDIEFDSIDQLTRQEVMDLFAGTNENMIGDIYGDFKNVDTKYYTPTLDEFYVGFEFEYKGVPSDLESNGGYIKSVFDNTWTISAIEHRIIDYPVIRVKYLDKEDIEKCIKDAIKYEEVKYSKSVWDWWIITGYWRFRSGHHITKIFIQHDRTNEFIEIEDDDICPNINIKGVISGIEETLFEGIIKNKSELTKLFKQLGI